MIDDNESPIKRTVSIYNLYYESFYQIMRQTMLTWEMTKNNANELNTDDWLYYDVIPENNLKLRYKIPTTDMIESGIEKA